MNFLYLALVALNALLQHVMAGEDYYQLLGVQRSASVEQIRKAFKKLAIRYHPDKNKDNPEPAKQMFVKIANAYEVLSDPEKRKIYDEQGEEGIKKPKENWGGQNFEGMFNQFFGQHQQFRFQHGGDGGAGHTFGFDHDEFNKRKTVFDNTEVIHLEMETISKFYRRQEVWFIYFYKTEDKKHLDIANIMVKLATKAEGVFQVGALNCAEQEELCEDFTVYDTPKVLMFKQSGNAEPITYNKEYNVDDLWKLAAANMHDFLEIVNTETYEEFMSRYPQQIKIFYFTNEESTAPLLKILSSEYRGYLHFGLVRASETALNSKFNVTNFPSLVVVNDTEAEPVKYTDEYKKDRLSKFLRQFKYSKLKTPMNLVRKLTKTLWDTGRCGSGDNKLCFLLVLDVETDNAIDILRRIVNRYEHDPIDFYYILINEQPEFIQAFPKFEQARDKVILFKPHRRKYGVMEGEVEEDRLLSFIDSVLAGTKAGYFVKERFLDIKAR